METINELTSKLTKAELLEYDLKIIPKFDWMINLKDEAEFKHDVYLGLDKIGTIELFSFGKYKFFSVTYERPIVHSIFMTEYDICDKYYHVSKFENTKFEIGITHPYRNNKNKVREFESQFTYVFNAIVLENDGLNFISIMNKPPLDEGEISIDRHPDEAFYGYKLKPATVEDAYKSLFLLHNLSTKKID